MALIGEMQYLTIGGNTYSLPSGGGGSVTSVAVSNATNGGLSVSGSPISSSGTITIGHSNVLAAAQTTQAVYPIKIDKNGHISAYGSAVTISDTKNTAGSTDSNSKLFLIGATSQAANPQTYSHDTAYVGTDGCLYSNSKKTLVEQYSNNGYNLNIIPSVSSSSADFTVQAALDNSGNFYETLYFGSDGFYISNDIYEKTWVRIDDNGTTPVSITGIKTPTEQYDAVNKAYVDGLVGKVKLTSKSDNVAYKLALAPSSITSGSAYEEYYSTNLTYNPSTKELINGTIRLKNVTSTTANTSAFDSLTLGNAVAVSSTSAHSQGQIILYGSTAYSHTIIAASGPTNNRTISLPDKTGTVALTSDIPDISGKIDTAGTGLSKSGTTLNHSNSVTAQTTQAVYPIKIDAQGHISDYGTAIDLEDTKVFLVTITQNGDDYVSDKTAEEIFNAYNAGRTVIAKDISNGGMLLSLVFVDEVSDDVYGASFRFVGVNDVDGSIYISNSGADIETNNGITTVSYLFISSSVASNDHIHGNITNTGDITTTATIASGDRLVINDESFSEITNSSITFGTSTSQYLANNGTWQNVPSVPTKTSDLTNDSGFINSIKTINNQSLIGSGDITVSTTAAQIIRWTESA